MNERTTSFIQLSNFDQYNYKLKQSKHLFDNNIKL